MVNPNPSTALVAWASGLFEGEGCINIQIRHNRKGPRRIPYVVRLVLSMTDEDVVRRMAGVFGAGRVSGPYRWRNRPDTHKALWRWSVDQVDEVYAVLELIHPWMGDRRRAKANQVLALKPIMMQKRLGAGGGNRDGSSGRWTYYRAPFNPGPRTCQWPTGCTRPVLERVGIRPYCGERDPGGTVAHTAPSACMLRKSLAADDGDYDRSASEV